MVDGKIQLALGERILIGHEKSRWARLSIFCNAKIILPPRVSGHSGSMILPMCPSHDLEFETLKCVMASQRFAVAIACHECLSNAYNAISRV